jgi:hypothetical protein
MAARPFGYLEQILEQQYAKVREPFMVFVLEVA